MARYCRPQQLWAMRFCPDSRLGHAQRIPETTYFQALQSRDLFLPEAGGHEGVFQRLVGFVKVEIVNLSQCGQVDICHSLLQVFLPRAVL